MYNMIEEMYKKFKEKNYNYIKCQSILKNWKK